MTDAYTKDNYATPMIARARARRKYGEVQLLGGAPDPRQRGPWPRVWLLPPLFTVALFTGADNVHYYSCTLGISSARR